MEHHRLYPKHRQQGGEAQQEPAPSALGHPDKIHPGGHLEGEDDQRVVQGQIQRPGEVPPPGEDAHRVLVLSQHLSGLGQLVQISPGVQGVEAHPVRAHVPAQLGGLAQLLAQALQVGLPPLQGGLQRPLSPLKLMDFLQREAQLPQQLDFQQRVDVLVGVAAVAVLSPGRGKKALFLVITDVGPGQPCVELHLFDGHDAVSFL